MIFNGYFNGFRVLVTGASGGIGKVIARRLLECGASVGVHYYKNKPNIDELVPAKDSISKRNVCMLKADLRKKKEAERLFKDFIKWAGGIDGLVNNAGDISIRKHFYKVSEKEVDADLDLNLKAPFWLLRLAVQNMEKNGVRGAIVNISSVSHKFGGNFYTLFYSLAKSALEVMTFSLGRYSASKGIRVNALRIGVFDTPVHDRHVKDLAERIRLIPAKRMGAPEEAAWWTMCLLHEKSAYMNGQVVSLTGGE